MKIPIWFVAGVVVGCFCGEMFFCKEMPEVRAGVRRDTIVMSETVRVHDTVREERTYRLPTVRDTIYMTRENTRLDTVEVEAPIVERHYEDSTYEAWVSGPIDPRLDSIRVYRTTETVILGESRGKRHWGLSVGAGLTGSRRGLEPGVFVGISYTLIGF